MLLAISLVDIPAMAMYFIPEAMSWDENMVEAPSERAWFSNALKEVPVSLAIAFTKVMVSMNSLPDFTAPRIPFITPLLML